MPYSQFAPAKAKKEFQLTINEDNRFLPEVDPIPPSPRLVSALEDLPWVQKKRDRNRLFIPFYKKFGRPFFT